MPTGPKGQKRPADVIGNAVKLRHYPAICSLACSPNSRTMTALRSSSRGPRSLSRLLTTLSSSQTKYPPCAVLSRS
jgi:hypothetical protein